MGKITKRILIGLVIVAVVGIVIFQALSKQTKFNEGYVNGNISGNLYNAGLFCESNGEVFFANPDDEYCLYVMNLDGTNAKKLCSDTVMYINADDNYVYYVRNNTDEKSDFSFFSYNNNSLCRIDRDGGKVKILDTAPCLYASLFGNYIYYLHYEKQDATTLYKIKIDGTGKEKVRDYYLFTCNANGKYFYCTDTSTGTLSRFDTSTDHLATILDCNCYKPIVFNNDNAYYLDASNDMALVHTNLDSEIPTVITNDSIDCYNVYGSYIYYNRYGSDPALCCIRNDGTEFKVLSGGTYSAINVTSYYVYFTDYTTKQIYYTTTSNPGDLKPFHPGVDTSFQ